MKNKLLIIFISIIFLTQTLAVVNAQYSNQTLVVNEPSTKYPILEFNSQSHSTMGDILPHGIIGNYRILIDYGHGQRYQGDHIKTFVDILTTYFGTVSINEDNITENDLHNVDLLIIPNTEGRNLTAEEVQVIQDYLENGGKLLIMGDYYARFYPTMYNELTNKYGIYWDDVSTRDNNDNYGLTFLVKVHTWGNDTIAQEIGVGKYVHEVLHSGTALLIGPYNSSVVETGPEFIGLPDNDPVLENRTYVRAANGSIYVPGVNYTDFGFHVAVVLKSGGKIFATGSTTTFSDDYNNINYGDDKTFAKLIVAWLLGVPSENVLLPDIENFSAPGSLKPQKEGTVSFQVKNIINKTRDNIKLKVTIPYFLIVSSQITIERTSGTESVEFVPGSYIELGTLSGLEVINVTFKVKEILGLEIQGYIGAYLYMGDSLIYEVKSGIQSEPAIDVSASFVPFFINISKVNYSLLYINVTNNVDYTVENVSIEVKNLPENAMVNATKVVISSINPGETKTVVLKGTVSDVGAYEFPLEIRDAHGSIVVRRPFLLAITQKLLVFDEGHHQYVRFASPYMQGLIGLMREFGPVLINKGEFPQSILDPTVTSVVVIPVPQPASASPSDTTSNIFTSDEIANLQSYVDNGGSLLLMGNWYSYFWPDNPNSYNDLTEPYGIKWIDGDLYDRVNNFNDRYYQVVLKNFADNEVARFLSSGVEEVYFVGTGLLNVTPSKPATVYPIIYGNDESFVTNGPIDGDNITVGRDCILIMASETNSGGRILASGSSYMFSDYYHFELNKEFIKNILAWLSKIIKLDLMINPIPATLPINQNINIVMRVKNTGVQTIRNIKVTVDLPEGLRLMNSSSIYNVGDLGPGEYKDIVWVVSSSKPGTFIIDITVSSDNYKSLKQQVILNFEETGATGGSETLIIGGVIALIIIIAVIAKFALPKFKEKE